MKKSLDWTIMEEFVGRLTDLWENENWQKVNHHDHTTAKKKDAAETTGDPKFDKVLKGITGKKAVAKQQKADTKQQARDAFGSMFGGGNPADKLKIKEQGVAEGDPNAPYTPSPAKPFRNPKGFNKQGTGVGNKLADLNRKEWEEKK